MDGLFEAVDIYCERTGAGLWAEPVNALTNLVFVAAGLWGVREVRRRGTGVFAEVLAWWVVAIGIGSGLFHTVANELTKWADILPIAAFTLAYTLFNLRRFMKLGWGLTLAAFFGFYLVAGTGVAMLPEWVRAATNESTGYFIPLSGLAVFGVAALAAGSRAGWYNLAAVAIFLVSITFRALDPEVCASFPLGTHFLWHTLNGIMLGVLLAAAARYGHKDTRAATET